MNTNIYVFGFIIFLYQNTFASSAPYTCELKWQTLQQKEIYKTFKTKTKNEKQSVVLNDTTTVKFEFKDKKTLVNIRETGKDKTYSDYQFTCDTSLNCSGSRNLVSGKSRNTDKIKFTPSVAATQGFIGQREVASYTSAPKNGFEFRYTMYKDKKDKPMGLWVSCHE